MHRSCDIYRSDYLVAVIRGITKDTWMKLCKWLLSSLPSCNQWNDEQKFIAEMEILKIMWHQIVKMCILTHLACCLPSKTQTINSYFACNPMISEPATSLQNSDIVSKYPSKYSFDPSISPISIVILVVPGFSGIMHQFCQMKLGVVIPLVMLGSAAHP